MTKPKDTESKPAPEPISETNGQAKGWRQRYSALFKEFFVTYGWTAIVCYMVVYLGSIALFYTLLLHNVDVAALISYLSFGADLPILNAGGSKFFIAYIMAKIITPLRFGISFLLTIGVSYLLGKLGLIKSSAS